MYFLNRFISETVTNGSIGLVRPKGYIPLGQRQKKPLLAVVCLDLMTIFTCVLFPLTFPAETLIDYIPAFLFMNLLGCWLWLMAIHTHSFYIQQNETTVKWRNWRFKTREFDYSSITKIRMQVNGKGGHLLISSSQMGRYRLGFSPVFFDATYIYHMILFRERYGVWPPKFGDYEDMDALIKVICYAHTYEIGSPEAGEYRQIPEHLQRILDASSK